MDGKRLSQRIFRVCLFPGSAHANKYVGNQVNPCSSFLRNINHVIPGSNITGVVRLQSAKTVFLSSLLPFYSEIPRILQS